MPTQASLRSRDLALCAVARVGVLARDLAAGLKTVEFLPWRQLPSLEPDLLAAVGAVEPLSQREAPQLEEGAMKAMERAALPNPGPR